MATISEVLRAKAVQVRTEVRQDDPRQSAVRRTRRLETHSLGSTNGVRIVQIQIFKLLTDF